VSDLCTDNHNSSCSFTYQCTSLYCINRNINWTAPEVLVANGESVCEKADVWSLAVVCSEILSGEIPFDSVQCRRMSMESFVGAIANNLRPPLPNNINPRLRSAVSYRVS
jgi:serine/threonine protein kinase